MVERVVALLSQVRVLALVGSMVVPGAGGAGADGRGENVDDSDVAEGRVAGVR